MPAREDRRKERGLLEEHRMRGDDRDERCGFASGTGSEAGFLPEAQEPDPDVIPRETPPAARLFRPRHDRGARPPVIRRDTAIQGDGLVGPPTHPLSPWRVL